MLKHCVNWLAACACLAGVSAAAQTNGLLQVEDLVQFGLYRAHPTRLLARFKEPGLATQAAATSTLKTLGMSIQRQYSLLPGGVLLDAKGLGATVGGVGYDPKAQADVLRQKIAALQASGLFSVVEPDYYVTNNITEPTDAAFMDGTLWGLKNLGIGGGVVGADVITNPGGGNTNAWDITTGDTNVIVAVIDTGVRYTHRDLRNQMWHNLGEIAGNGVDDDGNGYIDDVYGINAIIGSGDPMDDNGHGSHVSGTIGAEADNDYPHVGVNWHVQLMGCKFLGPRGGFTGDAIECISYAVSKKARILSNSWGGGGFSQLLLDMIRAAHTNDVLFVVAAGNSGTDNDLIPQYPATYDVPNIISVAALDRADQLADFSCYGKTTVHLGAPGVEIFSCWNGSDTDYNVIEGTSMACPHVSGVAALILSVWPNATVDEMKERILNSAVRLDSLVDKCVTEGRVNAYKALWGANPDGVMEVVIDPPDQSLVLTTTNLPVFVKVTDLFRITNATAQASFVGTPNAVTFWNNGAPPDARTNDNVYSAFFDLVPYSYPPFSNVATFNLTISAPGKVLHTNTVSYYLAVKPENDMFNRAVKIRPGGAYGQELTAMVQPIITTNNSFAERQLEWWEPRHGGAQNASSSLWYSWSPAADSQAIIDTCGSSFDTVVGIYTGATISNLVQVAAADNVGKKKQAYVTFNARAGTTYRFAVAGANTNEFGVIRLRVEPGGQVDLVPPVVGIATPRNGAVFHTNTIAAALTAFDPLPSASGVKELMVRLNGALPVPAWVGTNNWYSSFNLRRGPNTIETYGADYSDNVSSSSLITVYYEPILAPNDLLASVLSASSDFFLRGTSGSNQVSNLAASKEFGEPNHAGNEGGKSVWWSWQAPQDGVLTLTTLGTTFDALLGVYTGDRVNALTGVASAQDYVGQGFVKLAFAVRSQTIYRIAVDGYGGVAGDVVLNYAFRPAPVYRVELSHSAGGATQPAAGTYYVEAGSAQPFVALANPYFRLSRWDYQFQGGDIATDTGSAVSLRVTNHLVIRAVFAPQGATDDFESGALASLGWDAGGWVVTRATNSVLAGTSAPVFTGDHVLGSGGTQDNQTKRLTLRVLAEGGPASFFYRVSSEFGWDFLEFYLDDELIQRWSGEVEWTSYSFQLPPGEHVLEWRYTKDADGSAGLDAAFIDNVSVPLSGMTLSFSRNEAGGLEVVVNGQYNQVFVIQAASDLPAQWRSIATNAAPTGQLRFADPDGFNSPRRFYRVLAH